jgi:indolepyruvate ferredoxin oxidoreductase beta subunit
MKSQPDPLNLIICGVGGQGNILISRLIGRMLSRKGYFVTIGETFGAAQRGGAVFSGIRISKRMYYGPLIPDGKGHIIVSLEPLETLRTLHSYGNHEVVVLTNVQPVFPVGVLSKRHAYPDIQELQSAIQRLSQSSWFLDATGAAMGLGSPIVANIIMLGALIGTSVLPLSIKEVEGEVRDIFPGSTIDLNLRAFNLGLQETKSKG